MPTIETNGFETYYESAGSGQPIVFAHAVMMAHELWSPQVEAFSSSYRTVTYDIRGHGETGPTDRESYSLELLADDLHALIEGLALENPIICGLSLGGMVAATYAARYPEEPEQLVVTGVTESNRLERLPQKAMTAAQNAAIRLVGKERVGDALAAIVPRVTEMSKSEAREAGRGFRQVSEAEHWKLVALLDHPLEDISFERIEAPTLFVRGQQETGDCSAFQMRVPNARRISVLDAGHLVSRDNPERFNRAMRMFLDDDGTGRGDH